MVTNQWQHRMRTVSLHPLINTEHEAGQAASTVFQVFSIARQGIVPVLPALVARAQVTAPLNRFA